MPNLRKAIREAERWGALGTIGENDATAFLLKIRGAFPNEKITDDYPTLRIYADWSSHEVLTRKQHAWFLDEVAKALLFPDGTLRDRIDPSGVVGNISIALRIPQLLQEVRKIILEHMPGTDLPFLRSNWLANRFVSMMYYSLAEKSISRQDHPRTIIEDKDVKKHSGARFFPVAVYFDIVSSIEKDHLFINMNLEVYFTYEQQTRIFGGPILTLPRSHRHDASFVKSRVCL